MSLGEEQTGLYFWLLEEEGLADMSEGGTLRQVRNVDVTVLGSCQVEDWWVGFSRLKAALLPADGSKVHGQGPAQFPEAVLGDSIHSRCVVIHLYTVPWR